jgi:probable F420-dependent oxidoreductase
MTAQARFGVRLPVAGVLASPQAIKTSAIEADHLGFDTLWVHDYLIWNKELDSVHISCGSREAFEAAGADYPPMFYESLTALAYCAAVTERVRLGVAVLILPYREPLFTAKQIASIDDLSEGRLELGIGQGAAKSTLNVDFEVLGVSRMTKVRRTREHLEAMLSVWNEDSPSFEGEFYKFEGATIYPKPRQLPHPPIWIGGQADKSLDMVADYADGWLSCWVTPEQFPSAVSNLSRRLKDRGRSPDGLAIGSEIQILLADSEQEAQRQAGRTMGAFEQGYAGTTGRFAEDQQATSTLNEIWASSLIGTPEQVRDRIAAYVDAGCTYFELKFIYHDLEHLFAQWRSFADVVMPAFR